MGKSSVRHDAVSIPLDELNVRLKEIGIQFSSNVWLVREEGAGPSDIPLKINWVSVLRDIIPLSGDQVFADIMKRATAIWILGAEPMPRALRPSSVRGRVTNLRRYLSEFLKDGGSDLDAITPKHAQAWLMRSYPNDDSEGAVSGPTVFAVMKTLDEFHVMRPFLGLLSVPAPFPQRFKNLVMKRYKPPGTWAAPPEPVCLFLLRECIRLIGVPADDMVRIVHKYGSAIEEGRRFGVRNKKLGPYAKKVALGGETLSIIPGEDAPWAAMEVDDLASIAQTFRLIQAACFVVITYTSGPRISEIRRAGPGTVTVRRHGDGSEHAYYQAKRSKKRAQDESGVSGDTPWILSQAGHRAMQVLDALSTDLRQRAGIQSYWITFSGSGLWPREVPKRGFSIISSPSMNVRLNALARFIKLREKTGWEGRLHSHMGRKCLARFIAKRDRRALEELALQFAHLSAYSVDIGYARPDSEYRRMVRDELADELSAFATSVANLPPERIFHNKDESSFRTWHSKLKTLAGKAYRRAEFLKLVGRGVQIFPGQWGGCAYRKETSACKGGATAPNPALRSPETCKMCANFIALPDNEEWWATYHADCVTHLRLAGLSKQVRLVVESRQRHAEDVLSRIRAEVKA